MLVSIFHARMSRLYITREVRAGFPCVKLCARRMTSLAAPSQREALIEAQTARWRCTLEDDSFGFAARDAARPILTVIPELHGHADTVSARGSQNK